jgi:hypothetical protein
MAVTMKNAVFLDVAPCRSCEMNRRFGGKDFSNLKMEAIRSSETSVHFTGSTRHPSDFTLTSKEMHLAQFSCRHTYLLFLLPYTLSRNWEVLKNTAGVTK